MANFPFTHAEIMALAEAIKAGLTSRPDVYPDPRVDLPDFNASLAAFKTANTEFVQANAAKLAATEKRKEALADLKNKMRKQLRYAENVTGFDDVKLNIIGWSDKRPRVSVAPGQALDLQAVEQEETSVVLSWQAPPDGGKPAGYRISRRDQNNPDTWIYVEFALTTKIKLTDQPRHIDLEYKVIARNKTGEGHESNTVSVVL